MSSITPSDTPKKPSRLSWIMFAVGISLVPIGVIIWTGMTGVSPWLSPHRQQADRLFWVFLITAYALCTPAPLFARTSLLRRLGFSMLAAGAVYAVQCVCAVIHLLLIGV